MNFILLFLSILIIIITTYFIFLDHNSKLPEFEEEHEEKYTKVINSLESTEDFDYSFNNALLNEIDIPKDYTNEKNILHNNYNFDNTKPDNNRTILHHEDSYTCIDEVEDNLIIVEDNYNLIDKINNLKSKGLKTHEIAKELGRGVREVDTILRISKIKNN